MACDDNGVVDGGTFNNVILNTSTINNSELSNAKITGNPTLDGTAAQAFADALCPLVKDCVEFPAEDVAKVFRNCAGAAHVPNASIPTCAEVDAKITAALDLPLSVAAVASTTGEELPTTLFGTREALLGKPVVWLKIGQYRIPAYLDA